MVPCMANTTLLDGMEIMHRKAMRQAKRMIDLDASDEDVARYLSQTTMVPVSWNQVRYHFRERVGK